MYILTVTFLWNIFTRKIPHIIFVLMLWGSCSSNYRHRVMVLDLSQSVTKNSCFQKAVGHSTCVNILAGYLQKGKSKKRKWMATFNIRLILFKRLMTFNVWLSSKYWKETLFYQITTYSIVIHTELLVAKIKSCIPRALWGGQYFFHIARAISF